MNCQNILVFVDHIHLLRYRLINKETVSPKRTTSFMLLRSSEKDVMGSVTVYVLCNDFLRI